MMMGFFLFLFVCFFSGFETLSDASPSTPIQRGGFCLFFVCNPTILCPGCISVPCSFLALSYPLWCCVRGWFMKNETLSEDNFQDIQDTKVLLHN